MKRFTMLRCCSLTILLVLLMSFCSIAGQWKSDNVGSWYEYDDGGNPEGGIFTIDGREYAFDVNGYLMKNQWFQEAGIWYYCLEDGTIARSCWIDSKYYVDAEGRMLTDTWTPDGYYVGGDGAWTGATAAVQAAQAAQEDRNSSAASGSGASAAGGVYYWTPGGGSYHTTSGCRSLSRSRTILSGTLEQAKAEGKTDPCNNCVR